MTIKDLKKYLEDLPEDLTVQFWDSEYGFGVSVQSVELTEKDCYDDAKTSSIIVMLR